MKDTLRLLRLGAAPIGSVTAIAATILLAWLAHGSAGAAWIWTGALADFAGIGLLAGGLLLGARADRAEAGYRIDESEREKVELAELVRALEAAKRESDVVLSSVRAHLMLIDSSFFIQSRYSNELEEVFHQTQHGSENLLSVLQRLLSDRMFRTARDYLTLLFDASKKERTVLKVNPLQEIEVNVTDAQGRPALRYLNFKFRRIIDRGHIARVLVSVEDVTDRTVLEHQLRDSENQKVRQFELLIGILHVEPRALDGFVKMTNEQLARIDEALKASDFSSAATGQTALLLQRLDVVLQRIHNIKGNASLLRLEHFEKKAQEFEQRVIELKYRGALGGDDFLTLVIALADFRGDLESLQLLRVKLASIQRNVEIREEAGDDLVGSIRELANAMATRLGKEVRIDADGFDSRTLPPPQRLIVKDVLIQLVRNSLAHGIEAPGEREAAKKPRVATIDIHPTSDAGSSGFGFSYRDDGRGLDAERIKRRAVELELLAPERLGEVADSEVASFIFASGFSTAEDATLESGRGMGMNLIKQRVVDECGGEITVNSETGNFCEFSFVLPAKTPALAR
jgi:HPt (histidine-containing phosphotransfer) domain-containing protein